ncbi:hypothetical protein QBC37DRAFT_411741 [Rhypophila decipiens]|uniref:Protein YAE1 n=1 Tax=Rhypophila decipiens TaxID=261697 RepID=A0AAN7BCG0_9PEZI|nr:hypothetical protein QBC37DRAFT_411741 [Rhypophila decipiens]
MLLRNNSSSGEADQDIYLNMTSSASLQTRGQRDEEEDIVSIPAAPTNNTEQSIYHTGHNEIFTSSDMNDDVWGDDDSSLHSAELARQQTPNLQAVQRSADVSDIPRLKQEHTTAGYRDGVTIAKVASVQAGFDEGYGLGATIGAQAGRLLGLLQGLVGALSSNYGSGGKDGEEPAESKRLQALLETATKELSVLSVFGEEYFARDGIWKYEVVSKVHTNKDEGKNGAGDGKTASLTGAAEEVKQEQHPQLRTSKEETGKIEQEKEEETIVFADIAASHPLLKKWDGILQQEAERYGLVWDVLLPEEDHHEDHIMEDAGQPASAEQEKDKGGKKPAPVMQNKGALAW